MSSDDSSIDDLLIRARRDELSAGDERRLREALTSSSETRLLFEAGCAFDREAPVLPGDDTRIEGMLRAVQRRRSRRRGPVPTRTVWRALAAGMLFGGTAVAVVAVSKSFLAPRALQTARNEVVTHREMPRSNAGATPVASNGAPNAAPPGQLAGAFEEQRQPPASQAPTVIRAAAAVPGLPAASARSSHVEVGPSAPAVVGSSARLEDVSNPTPEPRATTSVELFRTANQARMQGDSPRAISLYQRLETEFPNSAEALNARLSLGMLYLHSGQASLALEQFRAYGALAHGPTLGEALWGESQALHQLGQRAAERRVLEDLLARFPESVYAAAAKKRLAEP